MVDDPHTHQFCVPRSSASRRHKHRYHTHSWTVSADFMRKYISLHVFPRIIHLFLDITSDYSPDTLDMCESSIEMAFSLLQNIFDCVSSIPQNVLFNTLYVSLLTIDTFPRNRNLLLSINFLIRYMLPLMVDDPHTHQFCVPRSSASRRHKHRYHTHSWTVSADFMRKYISLHVFPRIIHLFLDITPKSYHIRYNSRLSQMELSESVSYLPSDASLIAVLLTNLVLMPQCIDLWLWKNVWSHMMSEIIFKHENSHISDQSKACIESRLSLPIPSCDDLLFTRWRVFTLTRLLWTHFKGHGHHEWCESLSRGITQGVVAFFDIVFPLLYNPSHFIVNESNPKKPLPLQSMHCIQDQILHSLYEWARCISVCGLYSNETNITLVKCRMKLFLTYFSSKITYFRASHDTFSFLLPNMPCFFSFFLSMYGTRQRSVSPLCNVVLDGDNECFVCECGNIEVCRRSHEEELYRDYVGKVKIVDVDEDSHRKEKQPFKRSFFNRFIYNELKRRKPSSNSLDCAYILQSREEMVRQYHCQCSSEQPSPDVSTRSINRISKTSKRHHSSGRSCHEVYRDWRWKRYIDTQKSKHQFPIFSIECLDKGSVNELYAPSLFKQWKGIGGGYIDICDSILSSNWNQVISMINQGLTDSEDEVQCHHALILCSHAVSSSILGPIISHHISNLSQRLIKVISSYSFKPLSELSNIQMLNICLA
ncbi:hypothetical protein ADUPG1_011592 [Aduncisulcus paluster]|uniref:Uncharacterized protein n=1 Tax=Aduncisulcus paluster TaxID=2918883 RepID=A0ABQ5K062_9EUKA|nr:hypothetical protein ADUPG1_011592 [Aduncisulcus paluster]